MAHTHELEVDGRLVRKRYTSWSRDEHRREWSVLQRVHRHCPGLGPEPISADLLADPPVVTMTVIDGEPLAGVLSPQETKCLAVAITTLWSVSQAGPPALDAWRDDLGYAQKLVRSPWPDADGDVAAAREAALQWWRGPDPVLLRQPPTLTVLGHGDPNLSNYLWDGRRVRIVDFEDAGISDPAAELARLAEHLSARSLDVDSFCARFEVDPIRLRAARRVWAMFWLWLFRPGGPAESRNPPGTANAQARRLLELLSEP
ncbi:aminoglycoside phosphotransferase family protein [Actinoplanes sp. ATCC 53533]|uniref:phosphotransferase n=1 Tax=Actinoplanes sp. ATCC 53533 TaxID=1288362 RepID=UPI00131559FC